jgi:hypothetical protein
MEVFIFVCFVLFVFFFRFFFFCFFLFFFVLFVHLYFEYFLNALTQPVPIILTKICGDIHVCLFCMFVIFFGFFVYLFFFFLVIYCCFLNYVIHSACFFSYSCLFIFLFVFVYLVYSVRWNGNGNDITKNLVVMENLFCSKTVTKIYDLKGSKRSRYVRNPEKEVLLDENLVEGKIMNK